MNLQHDCIVHLCQQLRFVTLADQYSALAQSAASKEPSYPDFLEQALGSELAARQARIRNTPRTRRLVVTLRNASECSTSWDDEVDECGNFRRSSQLAST